MHNYFQPAILYWLLHAYYFPASTAESGSTAAIAVGVSVGCLVVLIAIALVGVVVLMTLQRRRKSHNVDFEGEKVHVL